jgi:hypothetical protein
VNKHRPKKFKHRPKKFKHHLKKFKHLPKKFLPLKMLPHKNQNRKLNLSR